MPHISVTMSIKTYDELKSKEKQLGDAINDLTIAKDEIESLANRLSEMVIDKKRTDVKIGEFVRKYAASQKISVNQAWEIFDNPYPNITKNN